MKAITGNIRSFFSQLLNDHQECELCLQPTRQRLFICEACRAQLPSLYSPCSQCGEELPGHGYVSTGTSKRCGQCQAHPPAFDYVICQYRYQPPISHWVLKMKDKRQFIWAEKIVQLMQQNPPALLNKVDQIVFIPSHPLRRFQRGFNPAEWIARELSRAFAIPLATNALIKGSGKDQRQLNRQQRRVNLQNSLRKGSAQLTGQHILIIDDVMTTGATLDVAASLLKQQGAHLVGAWVFARTPKYDFSNSRP